MKKFTVVSLLALTILSLSACGKKDEPEPEAEHQYAVNDIIDTSEEDDDEDNTEDYIDDYVDDTEEPTTEIDPALVGHETLYDVTPDTHANDVKDLSIISVDGQLIGLPLTYDQAKEKFKHLYTCESRSGAYIEIADDYLDSYVDTTFEIYAIPVTGDGIIKFIFSSSDDKSISLTNMICNRMILSGGNIEGNKVMSTALPNQITYGCSYDTIRETYGKDGLKEHTTNDGKKSFRLKYEYPDMHIAIDLMGSDGGLNYIIMDYLPDNIEVDTE